MTKQIYEALEAIKNECSKHSCGITCPFWNEFDPKNSALYEMSGCLLTSTLEYNKKTNEDKPFHAPFQWRLDLFEQEPTEGE